MNLIKEFRNPVFDIGIISIILFVAGVFILNTNQHYGNFVLFTGAGLGVLFSLINIVTVATTPALKGQRKIFWLVIVILVPVLGGFMYYIFTRKNEKGAFE